MMAGHAKSRRTKGPSGPHGNDDPSDADAAKLLVGSSGVGALSRAGREYDACASSFGGGRKKLALGEPIGGEGIEPEHLGARACAVGQRGLLDPGSAHQLRVVERRRISGENDHPPHRGELIEERFVAGVVELVAIAVTEIVADALRRSRAEEIRRIDVEERVGAVVAGQQIGRRPLLDDHAAQPLDDRPAGLPAACASRRPAWCCR